MQKDTIALTLESEIFNELKENFNAVLQKTLINMESKESEQAELTMKLKISLTNDTAPDFSEIKYKAEREIVRPTFTHKISSVMQTKCEKSGEVIGDYELVWDKDSGKYIMRPIDNGQMTMFKGEEEAQEVIPFDELTESMLNDYDYEEPGDDEE